MLAASTKQLVPGFEGALDRTALAIEYAWGCHFDSAASWWLEKKRNESRERSD